MRRGGGGPHSNVHVQPIPKKTTGLPFPQCVEEALNQICRIVRVSGHNRSRTIIGQLGDLQTLIDNDIFCLTPDKKASRLTEIQKQVLVDEIARFFAEKTEDPNKYAYFELLFLGKEGESVQHDLRIKILFHLASWALQYPAFQVYMQISQWLNKVGDQKPYAQNLVKMLVNHFLYPDTVKNPDLYAYLEPLGSNCPEFTVFFLSYATSYISVTNKLAYILGGYLTRNIAYILNQFRDSPGLAERFAYQVFPTLLKFVITDSNRVEGISTVSLRTGVLLLLNRWHTKVKNVDLNIDPLFDPSLLWNRIGLDILCALASGSSPLYTKHEKAIENLNLPVEYRATLESVLCDALKHSQAMSVSSALPTTPTTLS